MIRKTFTLLFVLLAAVSAIQAQTNFRNITLEQAFQTAKTERKMVFVDFYTDWCGPCKMMARQVFPQKAVGDYMNKRFVCIKLNAEKEGKEDASRFQLKAYPTFIMLSPDRKIIGRHEGGTPDGEKFIGIIETLVNPNLSADKMKERYEKGERGTELIRIYAANLIDKAYDRMQPDTLLINKTIRIVNDYFTHLSEKEKWDKNNMFVYNTLYCKDFDDPKIEYVNKHIERIRKDTTYQAMKDMSDRYYTNVLARLLSKNLTASDVQLSQLKKEISDNRLLNAETSKAAFDILETYGNADKMACLNVCEKEFKLLTVDMQEAMLTNMGRIVGSDRQAKARAAKFMRQQFLYLPASTIYFAARELVYLEK